MIELIYNFLTGGVFSTLRELIEAIVQWVITFITNTTYNFFEPLIDNIFSVIPLFDISNYLNQIFTFITPYLYFILDTLFISKPILIFAVLSIIFRVIIRSNTYIVKLIMKWYHILMP